MKHYVLDTNIISEIVRRRKPLIARMATEVKSEDIVFGCPMVWYEVRRGLLAIGATLQLTLLEEIFAKFTWQEYTPHDWTLATVLWSRRRKQGAPISDADLLIAVFAVNRNAILVTNNEKDFTGLGVSVENWLN